MKQFAKEFLCAWVIAYAMFYATACISMSQSIAYAAIAEVSK